MMKRNILAVVIPALLAAGKTNAVEIYNKDGNNIDFYGKVVGLHSFSNDKKENQDQSYARVGIKSETQITDKLSGYSQWEYNLESNQSSSKSTRVDRTRLGFAGFKFANYGSFDYGRNYGILSQVEKWTYSLPKFSSDNYTAANNFMTSDISGVATYRNNNLFGLLDGLNVALQYQGKNNRSGEDSKEQNREGWGFASTYNIDDKISIGAAYASANHINMKALSDKETHKKAEAWTVGTKYNADNVYLAAIYAVTRNVIPSGSNSYFEGANTNKTHKFEVSAQYQFDFGLRPSVSYTQSKAKKITSPAIRNDQDMLKYLAIGTTYEFNKNISTYINYKINLLNANDFTKATNTTTDNIFAVGMVYQF